MRTTLAVAAALLCGSASIQTADAQTARPVCGDRASILQKLLNGHEEVPVAMGLSADGGVLEVLASPDGGFTVLVTYPARPTCVVAVGTSWQTLLLTGEPA